MHCIPHNCTHSETYMYTQATHTHTQHVKRVSLRMHCEYYGCGAIMALSTLSYTDLSCVKEKHPPKRQSGHVTVSVKDDLMFP